ncbi:hypothetical protein L6164_034123 [Bauhinia variegata]|uniref:Uncharacterized protein n=1 Tax=Bauhinia variegata TaxID=167791 RepID=A0ACB9KTW2_BAUVA|nr:hypothetical protein L6164_034123 [Bauhinia variegata]
MSPFPSSQERTVASALLLLSSTTPSPSLSPPRFDSDVNELREERSTNKSCRESFFTSVSKSSCSSLIHDDGSSEEVRARRMMFFSAVARCREMTFKVVRKSRSKVLWDSTSSSDKKVTTGMASKVSPGSASTEASCLSSSSSGVSSAGSLRYINRARADTMLGMVREHDRKHLNPKHVTGSRHIRCRADAILKVLSDGGSSEVRIRQLLGDSPDTSKALRMLLKLNAVKRSGLGGRHDPFIYTIAG